MNRCCSRRTPSSSVSRQLSPVTLRIVTSPWCSIGFLAETATVLCLIGEYLSVDNREGDTADAKQPPGYAARRDCQSAREDRARLRRVGRADPCAGHRPVGDEQEWRGRQLAQARVWPGA